MTIKNYKKKQMAYKLINYSHNQLENSKISLYLPRMNKSAISVISLIMLAKQKVSWCLFGGYNRGCYLSRSDRDTHLTPYINIPSTYLNIWQNRGVSCKFLRVSTLTFVYSPNKRVHWLSVLLISFLWSSSY